MRLFTALLLIVLTTLMFVLLLTPADGVPAAPRPPAVPPLQVINGKYSVIATYDTRERQLTVTTAMPRDAFVCLRGTCRLVEEWLEGAK